MRFSDVVTEAFDKPYPYEWNKDDFGDYHALAFLDDGSPLELSFGHEGGDLWHVTFDRNFKFDVTGEGDQQRVFATVLAGVKDFVQKRQPQKIIFSATKSVKPGQKITSRAGLYNSLVNRYAAALGYTAQIDDRDDQVFYELTRIGKQPVAEGSRESKVAAMEKKLQDMQDRLELTRERRKMRGQRIQSTAEINLAAKMSELRQQIHQLKSNVTESASISTHGTTGGGYTWRFEAGREMPFKTDADANTFIRVTDPAGKTVAGVWADVAGDSLEIEYSQVFDEELRGRGLYTDLLKSLSDYYDITSDTDTNNAAVNIYKRLGADYDAGQARHTLRKKGVAEGSENNNITAQKIFFARSNKTPKGWSYDHVGFITQDGRQIQMSGHKGNDVYVTNDVTDDPEFPKQNIKIVSLSKPVSVPTTNSVGAENCGTFVANVLQANGIKGIDTQKIYSVFKQPPKQGVAESAEQPDLMSAFRDFLPIAMRELDINQLPPIQLLKQVPAGDQPTFGEFVNDENVIYLGISERHPVDILRTLAHELVHYKQNTKHQLAAGSGETGSPEENQAHEVAGVVMRDFNRLHPEYFDSQAVELTEDRSDYEIRNRAKLDNILVNLCRHVVEGQRVDPDRYGMVAACVVDPDNRQVIGVNELTQDGTRRHGERVAMERYQAQYGAIPEGSIIVTTCSPCNEEHMTERYGESCTDIINNSNCRKVYCGYQDPSQTEEHNEFTMEVTGNSDIVGLCEHFAATFLNENFADGKGPGRPGDSVRHGIPKNATMAELERASRARGRKGQLARWQLNMRRGRKR
jgi:pyrimidine deaminase RibD-like protein